MNAGQHCSTPAATAAATGMADSSHTAGTGHSQHTLQILCSSMRQHPPSDLSSLLMISDTATPTACTQPNIHMHPLCCAHSTHQPNPYQHTQRLSHQLIGAALSHCLACSQFPFSSYMPACCHSNIDKQGQSIKHNRPTFATHGKVVSTILTPLSLNSCISCTVAPKAGKMTTSPSPMRV